ncbi:hypothetical protein MPNT_100070 [Candidatus Methylacidithermus pantelleriae]|uniref:Uncharacterized protein n=1 Tax=Candidatus Methylacidithermus pantelleriae TaxID=2744239 RepID=A0A8J2FRW7_9BACT|nr:hypothetical protein MPNT_100070 [Candidatus Methylacidithermus pantelleriae]
MRYLVYSVVGAWSSSWVESIEGSWSLPFESKRTWEKGNCGRRNNRIFCEKEIRPTPTGKTQPLPGVKSSTRLLAKGDVSCGGKQPEHAAVWWPTSHWLKEMFCGPTCLSA